MFDYSHLYTKEEIDSFRDDERKMLNTKSRFNLVNFRANQKRYTEIETFAEQIKRGIRIWDIPCIKRRYTQDNDSSEEDEEDSEEEDEEEKKESEKSEQSKLVKEIIKQASRVGKGPKRFKHLVYLTNLEKLMIKR